MSTDTTTKTAHNDKTDIKTQSPANQSIEKEDDYMFYLKAKMDHFSAVPEKEKNY